MNTFITNFYKKSYAVVILCLGSGFVCNSVSAQILLATTNYFEQRGESFTTSLDLDGNQPGVQTTKQFRTSTPNKLVRVIFNAEASVASGVDDTVSRTGLIDRILLDGNHVCRAPGLDDHVFVSGNHTPTQNDGWVSAVTQCFIVIPTPGIHTIGVSVATFPNGAPWRIDDLSLGIDQ
jgi:hypothetical protein